MANFAGNVGFRISLELRPRVLRTPWVKTSSLIRCCGDYASSGPVRYIPKKSSRIDESKSSRLPTKSNEKSESDHFSDSISLRSKVSQRDSSFGWRSEEEEAGYIFKPETDDADAIQFNKNIFGNKEEFLGSEDEDDYEPEEVDMISGNDNKPFEDSTKLKQEAEKLAIQALATRAFTTVELRKKLQGKNIPLSIIDSVLTDFQNRGLLNDYLYAESFSQSRWSSSTWGPRRIKQALVQKGVSETDAKKAMKHVFEGDDSDDENEPNIGMSKLAMDNLFVQASKQWKRGQDVSLEKRKARIVRWLQYRGFNWGVTSCILKKLESQYPP